MNKEELKREFVKFYNSEAIKDIIPEHDVSAIFEWFWKHLEQRDELIKAADEVIGIFKAPYGYNESQVKNILERYQNLKNKPSTSQPEGNTVNMK